MPSTAFVRARIDKTLKDVATAVLAEFGLTVSNIVSMTLTRVAKERAVPLELKLPNVKTRTAMQESRRLMKKHNVPFKNTKTVFEALDRQTRKR